MGCFKMVLKKLKRDVQKKMGNLSAVKINDTKFPGIKMKDTRPLQTLWIEEAMAPRVAMDFTYGQGRVVEDPEEAMEIARNEGRGFQRLRYPPLHPEEKDALQWGQHLTQGYFHGLLKRDEAEKMLEKDGKDGVFLVRESQNRIGCLVLSYLVFKKVHHVYVWPSKMQQGSEEIILATLDGHTAFFDTHALIEFYRLNRGNLITTLNHPIRSKNQPDRTPPRHRRTRASSPKASTSQTTSPRKKK